MEELTQAQQDNVIEGIQSDPLDPDEGKCLPQAGMRTQ